MRRGIGFSYRERLYCNPHNIHTVLPPLGNQSDTASRGFTLIELLISVTLLGVIMVLILGAFRIGGRAWEKGDKDIELQQRYRAVLDLLDKQIQSMTLNPLEVDDKGPFILRGDPNTLEFTSKRSMFSADRLGDVHVKYRVGDPSRNDNALMVYEKKLKPVLFKDQTDEKEWDQQAVLISTAASIGFEFLQITGSSRKMAWLTVWEPNKELSLPVAVRITLKTNDSSFPIRVVSRILLDSNKHLYQSLNPKAPSLFLPQWYASNNYP